MDTYTRRESEIVVVDEDVVDTPVIGIENIHGIKLEKPTMRLLGTTFVNLLGKYGNFEVDTDGNGRADGIAYDGNVTFVSAELANGIFGSKAQRFTVSTPGAYAGMSKGCPFIENHKYFVSVYARIYSQTANANVGQISLYTYLGTNLFAGSDSAGSTWKRYFGTITSPITLNKYIWVRLDFSSTDGNPATVSYDADGLQAIDLTAAGALDPVRQAKYGVANWEDLTEDQLEAEIPYFDSVMSVNVDVDGASELTIENRGKNLYIQNNYFYYNTFVPNYPANIGLNNFTFQTKSQSISTVYYLKAGVYKVSWKRSKPASVSGDLRLIIHRQLRYPTGIYAGDQTGLYLIFSHYYSGLESGIITISRDGFYSFAFLSTPITEETTFYDIQLEEGSVATNYIPPRTDSITIPSAAELHGFGRVFNEWSKNKFTKRISRESKITDSSGNLALSGYKSGTKVIVMNNSNGEVQVLDAAASIATGWNSQDVTVWYALSSAPTIEAKASGGIYIYEGQNNVLSPNSKANLAMMLGVTTEGTEETRAFVRNFSVNSRVENIRFKPHFSRNVKTIPTSREYSISFDDPILDGSWDFKQHQDKRFTIKETVDNETESMEIKYHGCLVSELETSEDDVMVHRVSLVAETKEVS